MAGKQGPPGARRVETVKRGGTVRIGGAGRRKAAPDAPPPDAPPVEAAPPAPPRRKKGPNEIEFVVQAKRLTDGAPIWLTPSRTWDPDEGAAAVFVLRRTPTVTDRIRITKLTHELTPGGLRAWLDMTQAETDVWAKVLRGYVVRLGIPDASPEEEEDDPKKAAELGARRAAAIEQSFANDTSTDAQGLRELRSLRRMIEFQAEWTVLALDVPPEFRDLPNMLDEPPGVQQWLMNARAMALEADEITQGNG